MPAHTIRTGDGRELPALEGVTIERLDPGPGVPSGPTASPRHQPPDGRDGGWQVPARLPDDQEADRG